MAEQRMGRMKGAFSTRGGKFLAGAAAALLLVLGGFLYYIGALTGNVRTVVPGRVYRSARLKPEHLARLLREKHIRTVMVLDGGDVGDHWFRDEAEVCRRQGATLHSIGLRATALPAPNDLRTLLSLFDHADY